MRRDGLHGFMLPPFRRDIGGAERGGEQLGWLSGRRLKHTPLWQAEFDQMGLPGVSLCTSFCAVASVRRSRPVSACRI